MLLQINTSITIPDTFLHDGLESRRSSSTSAFSRHPLRQIHVGNNHCSSSITGNDYPLHSNTKEQSAFLSLILTATAVSLPVATYSNCRCFGYRRSEPRKALHAGPPANEVRNQVGTLAWVGLCRHPRAGTAEAGVIPSGGAS